ncbi:uncharacterized protein PAC_08681 [Phialocephala subalpina]|uniref:Uncharacterized protein n=1 Tax=Phialocephala subalpina TaxID=576137 RepID=A0A1L7X197_9HELO|nr:uncharacterized protein PAC_08681 [Phialocephala subalpina]
MQKNTNSVQDLPRELREQIWEHQLDLQPTLLPPALLLSGNHFLQEELNQVFRKVNYVVTIQNQAVFRRMPMDRLMELRHITVMWEGSGNPALAGTMSGAVAPLNLDSAMTKLKNNFESLTMDFQRPNGGLKWRSITQALIVGGQGSVIKITTVHNCPDLQEDFVRKSFNRMFGFAGRQYNIPGSAVIAWVWEGTGQHFLQSARSGRGNELPIGG